MTEHRYLIVHNIFMFRSFLSRYISHVSYLSHDLKSQSFVPISKTEMVIGRRPDLVFCIRETQRKENRHSIPRSKGIRVHRFILRSVCNEFMSVNWRRETSFCWPYSLSILGAGPVRFNWFSLWDGSFTKDGCPPRPSIERSTKPTSCFQVSVYTGPFPWTPTIFSSLLPGR